MFPNRDGLRSLVQVMNEAERSGTSGSALQTVEDQCVPFCLPSAALEFHRALLTNLPRAGLVKVDSKGRTEVVLDRLGRAAREGGCDVVKRQRVRPPLNMSLKLPYDQALTAILWWSVGSRRRFCTCRRRARWSLPRGSTDSKRFLTGTGTRLEPEKATTVCPSSFHYSLSLPLLTPVQLFFGLCRSGYQGGTTCAIHRAIAFAPYADLLWMETKSPIYKQAKEFADGVHAAVPGQWLAYNLSPSFNWDAAGLGESEMKDYVWELGKLGFGTFPSLPLSSAVLFLAFHPRPETDGQSGLSSHPLQSGSSLPSEVCTRTPTSRTSSRPRLPRRV